jgi:hypothetical protein
MTSLLLKLEPICYYSGTVIANELEEFNEISFCMSGQCVIGYEINNQKRFCIKYTDNFVLGAYDLTFNKKSMFIYKAVSYIEGYFIRKEIWMDLINEYESIGLCIKRNILLNYLLKIRIKINVHKERAMNMLKIRKDC